MLTYENLTKRIEKAQAEKDKTEVNSYKEEFWAGYICALYDIRNDINTR